MNKNLHSKVSGIATYLPDKVLTNDDLSKMVDTNNEWIVTRTGIERRHIADDNEYTYDLAMKSAIKTLQATGLSALDIDCIIVSTTTPADRCPSTAVKVQSLLGAKNAFAFDIQAACSGFIYGLSIADSFIRSGQAKHVLLIGAETMSKVTDWTDRSTCVLFGDGAGSCIVSEATSNEHKVIATKLYSDGNRYDQIVIHNSEKNNCRGYMTMSGSEVFKSAVRCMGEAVNDILSENSMIINDVDWIIPHQANARIIKSLCEQNNYPLDKAIISLQDHANTSSATIPMAIDYGVKSGRIKDGNILLLTAMGAGLTWGSAIVKL